MKKRPRWFWTKGSSNSDLEIAAPQEYSRTSFQVKDRSSVPPSKPIEGLKRIPLAPAKIRSRAQAYLTGARRNFTLTTVAQVIKKETG